MTPTCRTCAAWTPDTRGGICAVLLGTAPPVGAPALGYHTSPSSTCLKHMPRGEAGALTMLFAEMPKLFPMPEGK